MKKLAKTARLRELIAQGCVAMPGVPNAALARQVERAGFEAVYISGAGLANMTAGLPDIGLLTLTEVARLAGWIADAVNIPAIVDADTGFGGAEDVGRPIYELERAGLAALSMALRAANDRLQELPGESATFGFGGNYRDALLRLDVRVGNRGHRHGLGREAVVN